MFKHFVSISNENVFFHHFIFQGYSADVSISSTISDILSVSPNALALQLTLLDSSMFMGVTMEGLLV